MARMHTLQALYNGKVVLTLLTIIAVLFVTDYHSHQSEVFSMTTLSGQTDELSHISKIKKGKAISYIENPYGEYDD